MQSVFLYSENPIGPIGRRVPSPNEFRYILRALRVAKPGRPLGTGLRHCLVQLLIPEILVHDILLIPGPYNQRPETVAFALIVRVAGGPVVTDVG